MMSASTKKCKKRNTPWSLCVLPFFPSLSLPLFLSREWDSIESDFMLVAGNIKSHLSTFYVGRLIISDNWLWLLPSTSHPFPPFLSCPPSIVVSFSSLCLHLSALNGDRSTKALCGRQTHPSMAHKPFKCSERASGLLCNPFTLIPSFAVANSKNT